MQDADCHVSILAPAPAEDCLRIQDIKAQVFMFDKDEAGDLLRRPRQCVPIACVKFKRATPIGGEITAANQTISEISFAGNTNDSFTLLKDSLAKMKDSFVLLSKETVINSKANHANSSQSKVPENGSGHRHLQQPTTELNKGTIRSETHKKDVLDKRKSTVSAVTESVKDIDPSSNSTTDVESYGVEPTPSASSKNCVKKVSTRTQRETSKDRKLKLTSANVSASEERSSALSTPLKVTARISGEPDKTEKTSSTKKRGQLPEPTPRSVAKQPLTRPSSTEASSLGHRRDRDGKCPLRTDVPRDSATVGKELVSGTDRKHQTDGSRLMPVVSSRKTRLIEALPVSPLSSSPSLTSAFSRRPSVGLTSSSEIPKPNPSVVVTSSSEGPKPTKSILRNPIISTVQNGSPVSTLTSTASGLQSSSYIYSRLTTPSANQKQPNCASEAPLKNAIHAASKQTKHACQTPADSAYKPKEKITLNSQNNQITPGDEGRPLFHNLARSPLEVHVEPLLHTATRCSPLEAKPVSIIKTTFCSTTMVESNAKTALKTCLATSLNSISSATVSRSKRSSSLHMESTSQSKPWRESVQTSSTSETQPTQTLATFTNSIDHNALPMVLQDKISQRAKSNSSTLVPTPAKTLNGPISFVQTQTKSASITRSCLTQKRGTEALSPAQPSVATAQKHSDSDKPSNQARSTAQSRTIQSTKTEPISKFQSQTTSLNDTCRTIPTSSSYDADRTIKCSLQQNANLSPALKESGVKPILKSPPDHCLAKDSDRSKCMTNIADNKLDAPPIVAIPQKKLILLQHGFISSITKQLASDLNDVANLLRSSKSEKVNHREKEALLCLREINSKFTELTPICVQYKQLFLHLKDGHPVRLPDLDQLYSQEYTMNECCNVLGKVFSELKTAQLKTETVLQKRSLAITWLVASKSELISCINNIKSIVETVVLTCDLQSVPSTRSSPSPREADCEGNERALQAGKDIESKRSPAATQIGVKDTLWSPVRCQDPGQVTEALATERTSQEDRAPKIHATSQTKSQRLPEINESAATVSAVDHLVNQDQRHSEYEAGSTFQTDEATLPSGNCFGDTAKEPHKDGGTAHLRSDTFNSSDVITEEYNEQNGIGREPNTSEFPSASSASVEKSSPVSEEEKQAERDTSHRTGVVCTASGDSNQSSSLSSSDPVSSTDGTLSVEHPSVLRAAVETNDPSDVPQHSIKTEQIDPPNFSARPPQTIILSADDFVPPSVPTPGDNTTSSVAQSVSMGRKSVNNNDSPSMDFCSDLEICSVVRLEDEVPKQDRRRYESCVSLEWKLSAMKQDSLDEIPPLLTPDCAFGYSSIVYNVKSDEPPVLEANIDDISRNSENEVSTLRVSSRDSPALVVTPSDLSLFDVPQRSSSTNESDLVLVISRTPNASTIIMNSDDMVASGSPPSEMRTTADDVTSVDIDTRAGENIEPQVEQDAQIDIQTNMSLKDGVQRATLNETDEPKESCYVRVVGELTHAGAMAFEKYIDAQSSTNSQNQSLGNQMTRCELDRLPPIHDDSKENTYTSSADISYSQRVKPDQLDRPDDTPKTVHEVYLRSSLPQSIISREFPTTVLSTSNLNSDEMKLMKSDNPLAELSSLLYTSTTHCGEPYVALLSRDVSICGGNQSQYVFKIEPDDDFESDPVCSYDSPSAPEQPSASAPEALPEVSVGGDDHLSRQVGELDSLEPGDATGLLDQSIGKDSQVSSNDAVETPEAVVCQSPTSAMLSDLEGTRSISSPRPNESHSLNNEHVTVSESQSDQVHTSEISTVLSSIEPTVLSSIERTVLSSIEPAAHICQVVEFPLRLSSSESVQGTEDPGTSSESQEINSSREEQRRLSISPQKPRSPPPVLPLDPRSRPTSSEDRSASPPTVYTEPPQSPPPETAPLMAVIKQEITDGIDSCFVDMRMVPNPRTCRKRKRESRRNEAEPILVVTSKDEEEFGCSAAPPLKQRCADWSIQSYSQEADCELGYSIARVVQFCSSDTNGAVAALEKPLRAKAKRESLDRHKVEAVAGSDAAAALVEDKLMDGLDMTKPKMMSVCFSSKYNERHETEDDGKTNDEKGFKRDEKRGSRRCSRNRSRDRDSASSGSRNRDTHTERYAEKRTSLDSNRWRTPYRSSDDQREHRLLTRLSSGSRESLRDHRYKDEGGSRASPMDGRMRFNERLNSRRPNTDMTPRERSRGCEGRSNYRSSSFKRSPVKYEDQRSRSTRPMVTAVRPFETRDYNIRSDLTGGGDQGCRTVIDPSKLKRQFWSKGHPRFKCHEGCDHEYVTAPQDSDNRNSGGAEAIQRVGNSSPIQDLDFLEETLKLNLESSKISDGKLESRRKDDSTVPLRRGAKRSLVQSSDGDTASRRRKSDDGDDKDDVAKEEDPDDFWSTTSSRRSKTMSGIDKNSDCEGRFGNGPRMLYDEVVVVANGYSLKEMTSISPDGTERGGALQSSRCGGSSVTSGGSVLDGRISREFEDDESHSSLKGISSLRMTKSTLRTCRQMAVPAAAAPNSSSSAAAAASHLSRTSVTYVTEILQTSNFSTQVCIEKYKKVIK